MVRTIIFISSRFRCTLFLNCKGNHHFHKAHPGMSINTFTIHIKIFHNVLFLKTSGGKSVCFFHWLKQDWAWSNPVTGKIGFPHNFPQGVLKRSITHPQCGKSNVGSVITMWISTKMYIKTQLVSFIGKMQYHNLFYMTFLHWHCEKGLDQTYSQYLVKHADEILCVNDKINIIILYFTLSTLRYPHCGKCRASFKKNCVESLSIQRGGGILLNPVWVNDKNKYISLWKSWGKKLCGAIWGGCWNICIDKLKNWEKVLNL